MAGGLKPQLARKSSSLVEWTNKLNAGHKRFKEESCWHSWCCSIILIWPIGAASGLAVSCIALVQIVSGFGRLEKETEKVNIDLSIIHSIIDNLALAVFWTDLLVVFCGFREKIRTRFDFLRHIDNCPACCGKFFIKGVVNASCAVSVSLACVLTVLVEALYLLLLCVDVLCRNSQDAVQELLKVIPDYEGTDDPLDQTCESLQNAKDGSFDLWVGSMALVIGQFLVSLYWMKYSTLALALPFYQDVKVLHREKKRREGAAIQNGGRTSRGNNKVQPFTPALALPVQEDKEGDDYGGNGGGGGDLESGGGVWGETKEAHGKRSLFAEEEARGFSGTAAAVAGDTGAPLPLLLSVGATTPDDAPAARRADERAAERGGVASPPHPVGA